MFLEPCVPAGLAPQFTTTHTYTQEHTRFVLGGNYGMAMGREGGWEWSVVALGIKFNPHPTPNPKMGENTPLPPSLNMGKHPPTPKFGKTSPLPNPKNWKTLKKNKKMENTGKIQKIVKKKEGPKTMLEMTAAKF